MAAVLMHIYLQRKRDSSSEALWKEMRLALLRARFKVWQNGFCRSWIGLSNCSSKTAEALLECTKCFFCQCKTSSLLWWPCRIHDGGGAKMASAFSVCANVKG